MTRGLFGPKTAPPAYQLTLTDGTEPVCASNLPLIEKCGSGPTSMRGSVSRIDPTSADICRQAPMIAERAALAAFLAEAE